MKQVPEVAEVQVNEETGTLIRDGVPSILNPFDEYAVEAAIQLKEKYGGEVTIITMGPPQAKEVLLKALAMGGDKAIHMTDRAFAGADGVGGVTTGVVKAFVVADDMTKEQDKLTKIRRKATI